MSSQVLPTVVTRVCGIDESDELPESISHCLTKGAVEYAYQVLLTLADSSLLPPNDEPPSFLCIIDGSVVESNEELRQEFSKLGIPVGRVVASRWQQRSGSEESGKPPVAKSIPACFIVVTTGRATGDVYVYAAYYIGEWCLAPLPSRLTQSILKYMESCSAHVSVHEVEERVVTVAVPIDNEAGDSELKQ